MIRKDWACSCKIRVVAGVKHPWLRRIVRACLDIKKHVVGNSPPGAARTGQKHRSKPMREALILIVPRFAPVNPSAEHAG